MKYDELSDASSKYYAVLIDFVKDFIKQHPTWDEIEALEDSDNYICIDYRTLEVSLKNESELERDEYEHNHWLRYKHMVTGDMWMFVFRDSKSMRPNYEELQDIAMGAVERYCGYNGIKDYWSLPQYLLPTEEELRKKEEQERLYREKKEKIRLEKERIKAEHAFRSDATPVLLIIPDVHGRPFWKDAVERHPNIPVIFLGDYLDPYNNYIESFSSEQAITGLKQILEYKRKHKNRVILLLGNHDLHYLCDIDCSRKDFDRRDEILELFEKNINDFIIAENIKVEGTTYLFSHAGILPGWLDLRFPDVAKDDIDAICMNINERYHSDKDFLVQLVNDASHYRGGSIKFGSPVWADVMEHEENRPYTDKPKDYPYALPGNVHQIFGHSQQDEDPIYRPHFSCLDCRRAFLLTDKGVIMELENNI